MPQLYLMLGRIEQAVKDVRSTLNDYKVEHVALSRRVTSLERSRTWQKAWIAGAIAVATGAFGFATTVYELLKK